MAMSLKDLAKFAGEFKARSDANDVWNLQWQWAPTLPTYNKNGITGWALRDGECIRLHICQNTPCTARYPASKYGHFPVPHHARLVEPETETLAVGTAAAAASSSGAAPSGGAPAVAGPGAEQGIATPCEPVPVAAPPPGTAAELGFDQIASSPPPPASPPPLPPRRRRRRPRHSTGAKLSRQPRM